MRISTTLLLFLILVLSICNAKGQIVSASNNDSIKSISLFKRSLVPVSLIGLGIIINNSNFEKNFQVDLRNKVGNDYMLHIDNYLQYVPAVEIYTFDLLNVEAKNHWFDQTKYLLMANLISSTATQSLKRIIPKERPNGRFHSFPSGHTTLAFTNACVLYNEFHNTAPVIAYSGYAFAVTTGLFRMMNNAHWMSDVLVGAGIGILSAELVYYFEPLKNFNPFEKAKNVTLVPQIGNDNYGLYFAYRF